jgi:hypothetical protein
VLSLYLRHFYLSSVNCTCTSETTVSIYRHVKRENQAIRLCTYSYTPPVHKDWGGIQSWAGIQSWLQLGARAWGTRSLGRKYLGRKVMQACSRCKWIKVDRCKRMLSGSGCKIELVVVQNNSGILLYSSTVGSKLIKVSKIEDATSSGPTSCIENSNH